MFGVVEYQVPPESCATWEAYVDHIEGLPLSAPPQVFGLHASADIAKDHHEADKVSFNLEMSLCLLRPKQVEEGGADC